MASAHGQQEPGKGQYTGVPAAHPDPRPQQPCPRFLQGAKVRQRGHEKAAQRPLEQGTGWEAGEEKRGVRFVWLKTKKLKDAGGQQLGRHVSTPDNTLSKSHEGQASHDDAL